MPKPKIKLNKIFVLSIISVLVISAFVLAKPNKEAKVTIPSHAVKLADGVYSLGTARDLNGNAIEGLMFIDYKKENARPPGVGNGKNSNKCFAFLASGAKWKQLEPWVVNTVNREGLINSFIFDNLGADIQKWEDASLTNILGSGSTTTGTLVADTSSPDNLNEVYFGDVGSSGAIAVTIVWGIFSGPLSIRELVEWDQVYDQVDFNWGSTGEANKMDFENIATHELGHTVGLGHPSDGCIEETMFRFADFGETKKRTLNTGDIAGINALY